MTINCHCKLFCFSIAVAAIKVKRYNQHFVDQLIGSANCNQLTRILIVQSLIRNKTNLVSNNMLNCLPFCTSGEIVHGFGRGSKDLGIPTANYPLEVVKSLPGVLQTGIYYGWANVDNGDVHKMVMSIGWNPYFENKEKSMETHILYKYDKDLYGHLLKVCIVGYLRPEKNFQSLDELISAIQNDIEQAKVLLTSPESMKLKDSPFFRAEHSKEEHHLNGGNQCDEILNTPK